MLIQYYQERNKLTIQFGFYSPILTFHKHVELSQLPEANVVPSKERQTDMMELFGPSNLALCYPILTSHKRIEVFEPPDANVVPSGEKQTDTTEFQLLFYYPSRPN
ncbi:unnamed protein product [Paramecium octaurelia]|uniref:Uncharacterized protein n=1 Tax=Paramecium octaurelia TaxID=43137 RepID=A0A8S1UIR8_PAROT|nr:unnamed protein product [Paramecium octaurelia]